MKTKHIVAAFLPLLAFSVAVFGQRTITEKEFWGEIVASSEAGGKILPRKETLITEELENGKLVETSREVAEYDAFGRSRVTTTNPFMGKGTTSVVITIGKFYYCREDKGRWKKSRQNCGSMSTMSSPPALRSKFTSETISEGGATLVLVSGEFVYSDVEGRNMEHLFEDKLWINPDKTINRRIMTGSVIGTKEITSRRTETYEYKVSIPKIVAPSK